MKTEEEVTAYVQKCCDRYAKTIENFAKNQHRSWIFEKFDDFIDNELDIEYTLDRYGRLKDVRVCFAIGGPSFWVDTQEEAVIGRWAGPLVRRKLSIEAVRMLLDYFEDYFKSRFELMPFSGKH